MSDAPLEDEEPESDDPAPVETRDLNDPRKERRFRDKLKRQEQERASFWRAVLNDKTGRREMWRLISEQGRAFNTDFSGRPSWIKLGCQQWVLAIYHDLLRIDEDAVDRMHAESADPPPTEQERASFWLAVLKEKVGRREMWRWVSSEGRAFNTDFALGPTGVPQPEATLHGFGRQQWALRHYCDLMNIDRRSVWLLHRENDPRFIETKQPRPQP